MESVDIRLKKFIEKNKYDIEAIGAQNGKIKEVKQILSDKIKQVKDFDTTKEVESKINTTNIPAKDNNTVGFESSPSFTKHSLLFKI